VYIRLDPAVSGPGDSTPGDSRACQWAYVYLSNRTFLNAHLIKRGLAEVDTSIGFKYRSRFMKLRKADASRA
jgi:site-specific DNA-methyltransferase (adenine-specific)